MDKSIKRRRLEVEDGKDNHEMNTRYFFFES